MLVSGGSAEPFCLGPVDAEDVNDDAERQERSVQAIERTKEGQRTLRLPQLVYSVVFVQRLEDVSQK